MIQRLGRRKYNVFALDIESHNDEESQDKNETSCWLGCLINEEDAPEKEGSYFYTIEEALDRLEALSTQKRTKNKTRLCKNVAVYIYNLSFEWSFFLPVMLKRGFKFAPIIGEDDEYVFNTVSTKSCSSVWAAELKFAKNGGKVIFRDLAKMFGGGLGKVAESFGLETQKGEIDYRENRLHRPIVDGHLAVTDEEKIYCFKDTKIIVEILEKMRERDDRDFWNAISMASYSMKKLIKRGYPRKLKPYLAFREDYPALGSEETAFLRQGVEGGITYAPEKWQFKVINQKIGHIDKHQMHPSSAFYNLFPYGEGLYYQGKPLAGRICACRIKISYDDVILHSIIKLIGLPFIEDKEIVVWDFEIPTMKKCYVNLKIEYIDGYAYKMRPLPWRRYYSDNYYRRLEAKRNGDSFNVLYYKLLNNSSYGKLLEKPHNNIIENTIREDGIIDSIVVDKPKEEWKDNAKYTYIPVGSGIPARSRVDLIETALKLSPDGSKIVYFDTDSIFFIMDDETMKVWETLDHNDFLGGWGWEETIDRAQFTAPKRYKTETGGKTTIKAGGINFDKYKADHGLKKDDSIPFDEVNIVSSKWQVQRAYRCKGGTLIKFQEKEMTVQEKYRLLYNKNAGESS